MEKKTNNPIYLGFASQKGGVGKSSLAEVLASILYYEKNISLAVVDCDGTQESFYKLRERDRDLIESSPELGKELHERLSRYGKKSYHIIRSKPERAVSDVMKYLHKMKAAPQLIIFDFPGHALTSAMMDLSITMDYIISPIEPDPQSLHRALHTPRQSGTWASALKAHAFRISSCFGTRSTAVPVPRSSTCSAGMPGSRDCQFLIPASTTPSDSAGNWHKAVSKACSAVPTCPLHRLSALRQEWMSGFVRSWRNST